jgi:hypothetical protein
MNPTNAQTDPDRTGGDMKAMILTRREPLDLEAFVRDCEQLAEDFIRQGGSGALAVSSAARALILALELSAQQRRRVGAETLRPVSR